MFERKKVKKSIKKVDGLVTGLIIGGAVASIFGLSRTKKGKQITNQIKENSKDFYEKVKKEGNSVIFETGQKIQKTKKKNIHNIIGKTIIKIVNLLKK